eukprot:TRINITY_DN10586_c0_g1_i1.p1 TRINITY_DN10586_c0_g1~~TRINITY_DN10586_c0_g1_i1.p1  ORF type:complete len:569 (-),score=119.29 TRINITY_DN10586_c0_g1_i1:69-1775(-)
MRKFSVLTRSTRKNIRNLHQSTPYLHGKSKPILSEVDSQLEPSVPYLGQFTTSGIGRKVYVESYGCQMNFADTEIVYSIMKQAGYGVASTVDDADVVFLNTCAIRDKAEQKIWNRLNELKSSKKKRNSTNPFKVGVLGCMAERLKEQLLESEKMVDLVAGPDAYRDLPRLLSVVDSNKDGKSKAINVMLSQDETYADITPVRTDQNGVSAYISIMRGCNNMCTYCIVPFTRGRERSRPAKTIEQEVRHLSEQGYKEIILLGQNVNSYNDTSESTDTSELSDASIVDGFKTVYKTPKVGVSFTELVSRISKIDPEIRIRFTSPHPKDFPDDLLLLIRDSPNVCKSLHIPAQSGSTTVLERMRRGYTREAYMNLINRVREIIPDVTLSSDFISGFCGETEQDHQDTLSLMREVGYDFAFMFAYSMREKTPAHRKLQDDVPEDVKKQRLAEVIDTFYKGLATKNEKEIGNLHLVLVEGTSRKSDADLAGRSDTNKKVVFSQRMIPDLRFNPPTESIPSPGDYVIVKITSSSGVALIGEPVAITTQSKRQIDLENITNDIKCQNSTNKLHEI